MNLTKTVSMTGNSFLSRQESLAAKSVLIFLIVLGHNMLFTYSLEEYKVMGYLYNFHIQAFFLLPFLYGSKPLTKERIKNYIVRLYWPFLIAVLTAYILYYCIYSGNTLNILDLIKSLTFGNATFLKKYTGIQIFWFLPAMLALSLIKDLYDNAGKYTKSILIIISCISLFSFPLTVLIPGYGKVNGFLYHWTPFSAYTAVQYLAQGIVLRYCLRNINHNYLKTVTYTLFAILSVIYFYNVNGWRSYLVVSLIRIVMPVLFMIIIYNIKEYFSDSKHLQNIGALTFPMYIIHPFIGYGMFFVASKYLAVNLFWAMIAQFIIFYSAYFFARGVFKYDCIRKILFPNNTKEFFS